MRFSRQTRMLSSRPSKSRSTEARSPLMLVLKMLGMVFSGGSFILGLVMLMTVWKSGDWFWKQISAWTSGPQPEPQVDVRSIVVKQVQEASELTTAIFTMEAVVPTQQDATVGGVVIGSTKLLYLAHGEVRAGIDLSKISVNDIQAAGDTLTVKLPPAKLLDRKIDVSRSSVYDYNRGALGLGPDVAPQLQNLAQTQALEKITLAACEKGILTQANDRAKFAISQLLKVPNYKTVNIQAQMPDLSACKANAALPPSPKAAASSAPSVPSSPPTQQPNPLPSLPTVPVR